MKFLIQKINKRVQHDFAHQLLDAIDFHNWYYKNTLVFYVKNKSSITYKYFNTTTEQPPITFDFKPNHKDFIPIGSVEFVHQFMKHFYGVVPPPINVPTQLFPFANRDIFNGDETTIEKLKDSDLKYFVKSNDVIKGYIGSFTPYDEVFKPQSFSQVCEFEKGNYQFSEYVDIVSEWRAFVWKGKLVGLQWYSGEFTVFPDVNTINEMIDTYTDSPIAYTLDVGINNTGTFVVEVHPMISVGLYGFSNNKILPHMFDRAFRELIQNKNYE